MARKYSEAPTDTQVAVASRDENIHEDPLEFELWRFTESGNRREGTARERVATKEMQAPIETPASPTSAAVSEAAIKVSLELEHPDAAQLPRLLYPQMLHNDTPDGTPLLSPSNARSTASDADLPPQSRLVDV
ncbi:hypothetical protein ARMGADRAFT_1080266 [Armillaria gallica]|uniref:Uncharacterized protein n=1 Tax=Armillaria gallica TaxID=47427 RepID=A0A2H3DXR0_ARMGA|nr:hypothetical protein ARMGADRAFT_1080266 [Armillaria gallica]